METTTSFDLNRAVQRWLGNLSARATMNRDDLEELESHLRDSMATLQAQGLSAEEAFHLAARRLGHPADLAEEFAVVNPGVVWRQRAFWMLAGMLFATLLGQFTGAIHAATVYSAVAFTKNGFALGWLSVGLRIGLFFTSVFLFWQLANGRISSVARINRPFHNRPVLSIVGVGFAMLLLQLVSGGCYFLSYRQVDATSLGQRAVVESWGNVFLPLLHSALVIAGVAWFGLKRNIRSATPRLASWLLVGAGVFCCSQAPAQAQNQNNPVKVTTSKPSPATLADAMKLWRDGKQSAAVDKFLTVDFSQRPLFPTGSVLNLTEAEFIALPSAVHDKMSKAMLDDIQTIKLIAGQVKAAARTPAKSAQCISQLQAAGEAFDRPSGLALLKLVGSALKKMAAVQP